MNKRSATTLFLMLTACAVAGWLSSATLVSVSAQNNETPMPEVETAVAATLTAIGPTLDTSLRPTKTPTSTRTPTPTLSIEGRAALTLTAIYVETTTGELPLPPDWERFDVQGGSIWLPGSFEGGTPEEALHSARLGVSLMPELGQYIDLLEQNIDTLAFWAFDSNVGPGGSLTNVNIISIPVPRAMSMNTILNVVAAQLPDVFQVVSREPMMIGDYEAAKVIVEGNLLGIEFTEVMYLVKDDSTVWEITYTTGSDEFADRLPDFERSAMSFVPPSD